MRRSSKSISLVLIGSAIFLSECRAPDTRQGTSHETTGTATRRYGHYIGPLFFPYGGTGWRGASGASPSGRPSAPAAVGSSSRGGFGSHGGSVYGG